MSPQVGRTPSLSRRPVTAIARAAHHGTVAGAVTAVLAGVLTCSGERFETRAVYLVSPDRTVDSALVRARQSAADGDWDGATALLAGIQSRHPDDPLALVATVLRARVALARGDVDGAARTVISVPPGRDPALDMQRDLVLGLVSARRMDVARGTALLQPLSRRMIDRAQTVEVDCGMATLDGTNGPAGAARALAALAQVESLADQGVLWLPTGLACDLPDTRAGAFTALLGRVDSPGALATVLDALPADSARRMTVARRLRAVADARHEIDRWRHWLADLPAGEATLMPVAGDAGPPILVVGVLAPVSGPRASIGVSLVREVQLSLESDQATEVLVEDEGTTAATATAAYERLVAQHVTAVVGPTQEELGRAVAARVLTTGTEAVPVYLLVPYADARQSALVRMAGPALLARTTRIAALVRSGPVALVTPGGDGEEEGEFAQRLRASLALVGVTVREPGGVGAVRRVVAGPFGAEARRAMSNQAAMTPGRWVFDGRAGQPGTQGVWVGLRPGPDLAQHMARYCAVAGEPPGELGLLAYDAAQTILAGARGGDGEHILAPGWEVAVTTAGPEGSDGLAVTQRCPVNPPPPPLDIPDGG